MCSRCSACAGRIVAEEALATMFEGCGREAWSVVFHVDGERTGGTLVMFCKAKSLRYARSASRMIDGVRDNIGHCALNRLGFNETLAPPRASSRMTRSSTPVVRASGTAPLVQDALPSWQHRCAAWLPRLPFRTMPL